MAVPKKLLRQVGQTLLLQDAVSVFCDADGVVERVQTLPRD